MPLPHHRTTVTGGAADQHQQSQAHISVQRVHRALAAHLLGKEDVIRQALICMLARGHVLIEDTPGVGKTTLARLLAHHLGLQTQRVQCTADLLPGDLVGMSVYDRTTAAFRFHPGPLFTEVLLVDEINRAPPRTQSGLLEAMAERQVSVDRTTHPLPNPFFVLATQNPLDRAGTHALPDSEMDRFLMRLRLGYPDPAAETEMLLRQAPPPSGDPIWNRTGLLAAQDAVTGVFLARPIAGYVQRLLAATRVETPSLSPRAGLAVVQAARANAWLMGRNHVLPDDVRAVFMATAAHRLGTDGEARVTRALDTTTLEP